MGARAEAAAETGRKILRATMESYRERYFDQVSLEDIAEGAGVTVQTTLRRYSPKDDLIAAAANEARQSLRSQRDEAPVETLWVRSRCSFTRMKSTAIAFCGCWRRRTS